MRQLKVPITMLVIHATHVIKPDNFHPLAQICDVQYKWHMKKSVTIYRLRHWGKKLANTAEDFVQNLKMDEHYIHWEYGA